MERNLSDRYGNKYEVREVNKVHDSNTNADVISLEIHCQSDYVGKAEWRILSSDLLEVRDIVIRNDFEPPNEGDSIAELLIKTMANRKDKKEMKNYREKGIGSDLLKLFYEVAQRNRVKQICGSIVKKDVCRIPDLIQWYEKRGFHQGPRYPGCITQAVTWIYLDVK